MSERTVTLVGNNGQREVLACPGGPFYLGTDAGLWGQSPTIVNSAPLGALPGEVVSSVRTAKRSLVLPISIVESTNSGLDARVEQLTEMVRANGGDVHIEVATAGTRNTNRTIFARYISGFEGLRVRHSMRDRLAVDIRFDAHDPYWSDTINTFVGYGSTKIPNAIGGGMHLRVHTIASTAEVWPIWTVTGITENIMAANLVTGQAWRFTEKLESAADVLEIRTDPRGETGAFLNGGPRIWEFDAETELWPLVPGQNIVMFSGLNSASDSSIGSFTVQWQAQFENC